MYGLTASGIAQVCAESGLDVILNDMDQAAVRSGMNGVATALEWMVSKGNTSEAEAHATQGRITASVTL
ncbi:hypothetical protein G2912_06610 [Paraburkholderia aspalathi]|nr:hypothetical protein [Paraburkholderia aspalathi]